MPAGSDKNAAPASTSAAFESPFTSLDDAMIALFAMRETAAAAYIQSRATFNTIVDDITPPEADEKVEETRPQRTWRAIKSYSGHARASEFGDISAKLQWDIVAMVRHEKNVMVSLGMLSGVPMAEIEADVKKMMDMATGDLED